MENYERESLQGGNKGYDPDEVRGFLDCGSFDAPKSTSESEVFKPERNTTASAIVEPITPIDYWE